MDRIRQINFRPLSGNLLSLQSDFIAHATELDHFRPLSGNLLSLQAVET